MLFRYSSRLMSRFHLPRGSFSAAGSMLGYLVEIEPRLHRESTRETIAAQYALAGMMADWRAAYLRAEAVYLSVLATQRRVSRYYAECLLGASLMGLGRRSEGGRSVTAGYRD